MIFPWEVCADREGYHSAPSPTKHSLPPSLTPSPLLGALLLGGHAVVPRDVAAEVADEDHGDHAGEEEDDEHGVGDGEPVHLGGEGGGLRLSDGGHGSSSSSSLISCDASVNQPTNHPPTHPQPHSAGPNNHSPFRPPTLPDPPTLSVLVWSMLR